MQASGLRFGGRMEVGPGADNGDHEIGMLMTNLGQARRQISGCRVNPPKWKLVGKGVSSPKGPEIEKWELYNLKEDRTELNDLALTKKDRLKSMAKAWHDWSLKDKVYPKPLNKKKQSFHKELINTSILKSKFS